MNSNKNNTAKYDSKYFDSCPLCEGAIKKKYGNLRDRFDSVEDKFNLYECNSCGVGFLNPMPVGDASLFYPSNYLSSENAEGNQVKNKMDLEKRYRFDQYDFDFKLLKRSTGISLQQSDSYLDIGCGSGERVSFVKEKGCKISCGIDKFNFSKSNLSQGTEIINSDILEFIPSKKFQIVSLAHVLEHLENPQEVLLHVKEKILSGNGHLFVQVPNYNAFERFIFRSRWFCFDAPRHLWHFNSYSLQNMLVKIGYKIEGSYTLNAPLHPVSIVPSLFRSLDIQRIWIQRGHSDLHKKILKVLWAGFTIATIPFNILQNLFNRGSMLTVIATIKTDN
jgi:2-polyprenyl-3-methyl-5-hydroxy-6-metoxy-1,4-benzoquinol methylase